MSEKKLFYCDLGFIDYKEAWDIQKLTFQARLNKEIPDILYLLEHPNTYTLGKTADKKNLIGNEDFITSNKINIFNIDRGGDITYHGPGQIVGYPIIDLNDWKKDTHKYLRALEEIIIKVLNHFNLQGQRNKEYTGVWIENRKIAAIGIKVSRWITMHGFAFNINTDLSMFNGIIPCGISEPGKEVTSLKNELGNEININLVKELIKKYFIELFEYKYSASRQLNEILTPQLEQNLREDF